jgi:hypothetical protein
MCPGYTGHSNKPNDSLKESGFVTQNEIVFGPLCSLRSLELKVGGEFGTSGKRV